MADLGTTEDPIMDEYVTTSQYPRRVTEAPVEPLLPQTGVCACTRGCTTTQCACRKVGVGCNMMCSCVTIFADACESPFSQLSQLFGEKLVRFRAFRSRDLPESGVRASPCLTRYLNLNPRTPRKLDVPGLLEKLLAEGEAWKIDPFLVKLSFQPGVIELRRNQDPSPLSLVGASERRKVAQRMITIYAMGIEQTPDEPGNVPPEAVDSPNSYAWSFCRDKWVPRHRTVHCEQCDVCYDLSWHCEKCGTCKAGRTLACDGCGGWSEDGIWNGDDGEKAPDAQKAQRELSQVSPRKRVRQVDLQPWNDAISETVPTAPDDIATRPCNCKDACDSRRCICRRWGGSCKHDCKCHQTTGCGNKFHGVKRLYFGDDHPESSGLRATQCFTDYFEKANKIDYRRPFHRSTADASMENLKSLLKADSELFTQDEQLREWRDKLTMLELGPMERFKHMQWLFRHGLSISEDNPRFYSFCTEQWTDKDNYRHCAVCKRCCSIKTSWHCGVCRQCRHEGLDRTCYRCGGRSSTAISRQEKEYAFWRNEDFGGSSIDP